MSSAENLRSLSQYPSATQPIELDRIHAWVSHSFNGVKKKDSDEDFVLDGSQPPFSFKLGSQDSRDFLGTWNHQSATQSGEDWTESKATWSDKATGLKVTATVKTFKRFPAVDWVLSFENTGSSDTPILSEIQALDITMLSNADQAVGIQRLTGDDCDETSFRPLETSLRPKRTLDFAPSQGRSSQKTAFPFFDVTIADQGFTFAIGWSGQWAAHLDRAEAGPTRIAAGLQKTHLVLHPGERIRTPRILMMSWLGASVEGHNRWRRLLLDHYVPRRQGKIASPPIASQCFDRYSWTVPEWATEKGQIEAAETASNLGCDTHWFDAAWFPGGFPHGVGNWTCKPEAFPHGLKPVSDTCHRLGINFLLWFEPERVADGTQIEREHPNWVSGNLFRLDLPDARAWLTDLLDQRIQEFGLDWYRQDFNMDPLAVWLALDTPDRQGMTEIRFIEGLYEMWDTLVARHPRLMIDDCSSGGRRIDLEMMMRSHPLWRSDTGCSPGHAEYPQAQTMTLSSYVPITSICSWLPNAYEMRSSATMGLAVQFDYLSPTFNFEEAKAAIQEVKDNAPFFFGDYYPLTSNSTSLEDFAAFQFHRGDLDAGIILAFRRDCCQVVGIEIVPYRIDANRSYALELIDEQRKVIRRSAKGSELLGGMNLRIPEKGQSLLVRYRREG